MHDKVNNDPSEAAFNTMLKQAINSGIIDI